MKRIALLTAALTLAAGAAMAATPSQPVAQHHQKARVVQISAPDRETQALNLLEAKGYGSFTNFQPAGKDYTATVTHDGHAMNVRVDPTSGMVTTQS